METGTGCEETMAADQIVLFNPDTLAKEQMTHGEIFPNHNISTTQPLNPETGYSKALPLEKMKFNLRCKNMTATKLQLSVLAFV